MGTQIKEEFSKHILALQAKICNELERVDGKAKFITDEWERPGGGGGKTRVINNGNIFEKGGVNTSIIYGELPAAVAQQLQIVGHSFFACGLSLVIHPVNPFVPTVHANWRYFEVYNSEGVVLESWFGGGTDLTPYYLFEEDAIHFHAIQKKNCNEFDSSLYKKFKVQCDDYFCNHHRNGERRGIGGIFFDHCKGDESHPIEFWKEFTQKNGSCFLDAYLPIVERRKNMTFNSGQKYWQEIRRGRYVEFNLLHDRGTLFGIKTKGRTESILMSLPPTVRFDYDYTPTKGSEEDKLLQVLITPKEWVSYN